MLDHAGFFRIFWEHSRRAPGRRARGPATTPDFRPFCARGLSQRCRLRQDGLARRAARSPRADAAAIRAPPTGGTAAIAPRLPPNRQPTKIHHHCRALLTAPRARRRRLPAEDIVSARVLLRCHCAGTSDSLRCDARSTRRAAGTRAPPHLTCASHACAQSDTRLVSRTSAGVVGVASQHSESSRPRPRPRSREPRTFPPPSGFFGIRRRGRGASGARVTRID